MPYRKTVFANNEFYHVLNRGVDQNEIFFDKRDYQRFLDLINHLRFQPIMRFSHFSRLPKLTKEQCLNNFKKQPAIVDILAFTLMPNHFHLLLRQLQDQGIQNFMKNLQNSYARYFNLKHQRIGHLFQGTFKAIRIETDEQFVHVSRYIHLNPVSSYLIEIEDLENYLWSSFKNYTGKDNGEFTNTKIILKMYRNLTDYKKFVLDQADYQRKLEKIKRLTIE